MQVIAIGSSVAENFPDPRAARYCAASRTEGIGDVVARGESGLGFAVIFSGLYGYGDAAPPAAVRQLGVYDPKQLARDLWLWSLALTRPVIRCTRSTRPDKVAIHLKECLAVSSNT